MRNRGNWTSAPTRLELALMGLLAAMTLIYFAQKPQEQGSPVGRLPLQLQNRNEHSKTISAPGSKANPASGASGRTTSPPDFWQWADGAWKWNAQWEWTSSAAPWSGKWVHQEEGHPPPVPPATPAPSVAPSAPPTAPPTATADSDLPQPILQLKKKTTVFIVFTTKGGQFNGRKNDRDVVMMREGIQRHPLIELIGEGPGENQAEIDAASKADFILYPMWGDLNEETCQWGGKPHVCPELLKNKLVPKERLAILDFSDGGMRLPWNPSSAELAESMRKRGDFGTPASIVFKRSLIHKVDGSYTSVANGCDYNTEQPCWPMDYAVRPANYEKLHAATLSENRKYSLVFLTDPYHGLNEVFIAQIAAARLRVKHWLQEMKLDKAVIGHVGGHEVKEHFMHADVVVVADPASYEGQHAIYEALGNGAVVMTNTRWVPMPYPLEHEKHVYYYDLCDTEDAKKAFHAKVRELLSKTAKDKAEFRLRAWKHALQHHQAANRMDYVVSSMLEHQGKMAIVPESLRVNKTGADDLKRRCVDPTMKARSEGKWLKNNPFLTQG